MDIIQSGSVDLHIHTNISDGTDFPEDCVEKAKELGLSAIAITDHNTFGAVEDAIFVGKELNVEIIPAIEIDADYIYPFHFLAYFGDMRFLELQSYFFSLKQENTEAKVESFVSALRKNGYLKDYTAKNRRFHKIYDILTELCREGHFKTPFDAEKELILSEKRIYREDLFTIQEIISKVKAVGGLIFWAHPFAYGFNMTYDDIRKEAEILKGLGINGLEALHYSATKEEVLFLVSLAGEMGLLVSGGSDYHGKNRSISKMGFCGDKLKVPYLLLKKIKEEFAKNKELKI